MDTLSILELKLDTTIGCFDWEKTLHQPLFVDIKMEFDNTIPAASDTIEDAINYNTLSSQLRANMLTEKNDLIETVAEKIAAWVLEDKRVKQVQIVVHKRHAVKEAADTNVSITRSRERHQPVMFDL